MEKTYKLTLSHRSALEASDLVPAAWSARNQEKGGGPAQPNNGSAIARLPRPWEAIGPRRIKGMTIDGCRIHSTLVSISVEDCILLDQSHLSLSAEHAISRMCSGLSLPRIIRLVDEACGTYRSPRKEAIAAYASAYPDAHVHFFPADSDAESCERATFYGLEPLTSISALRDFVSRRGGLEGVGLLRQALPYCTDGLRSPLETECHVQLFLPVRYGGMGLPLPQVNQRFELSENDASAVGKPYVIPDFSWPERKVVLEALGVADHTGAGVTETSQREKLYKSLGYECLTITMQEERRADELVRCARLLAKALGHRLRLDTAKFSTRQAWLRRELFATESTPVMTTWRDMPKSKGKDQQEIDLVPTDAYGV